VGLERYYTSSGVTKFIAVHGTKAYVGADATGAFTEIRAGLTDGKRCNFEVYKDLLMCSNGYDNIWVYDGASSNTTWELGACKAALGTTGGNLDATAEYYYGVTFDDDAVVNGAVSNTITTATSRKVELTNIPLGPVGTSNRKIYRTEGDGSSLKLLATIADNTTTTYSDDIADGSLGAGYPSVTDDMPKGSIIKVHRERFFITADPNYPNKIYYSNPYLPHYIQQTANLDYMEISPEDNDEIMGIPIQLGMMICIKKNTIRVLHITSPTSGADPTSWYADDPIAFTGSPAQWSITQTPYGVVFLGWDHWYRFDGSQVSAIIDEFDTGSILPSNYSDTVGFMHEGIFLAAYTDDTIAAQYHNRIMRYNFKRQALSYDLWTSTTVAGANCFAAKTGDDETGELYYGDSQNGYVVKEKTSEDTYRLKTKTEANAGTSSDVFVGGTENAPYIEIGETSAADAIADDIVIFWDQEDTTPGTGWTEISSDGSYLLIHATTGTEFAGTGHKHEMAGTIPSYAGSAVNSGDGSQNAVVWAHTHPITAFDTDDSTSIGPRHIKLRAFKSDSNSDTEFPDGAIVMWDQPTAPTGWQVLTAAVGNSDGYYIQMGSSVLNETASTSHSHDFSGDTDASTSGGGESDGGTDCPRSDHYHAFSDTTNSTVQDDWEVAYAEFRVIKKIGESDTWDGAQKFVYCLYDGAGTPGTGWTDKTSTYTGKYIKIGTDTPGTGAAANAAHTHTTAVTTTGVDVNRYGNGGYHAQCQGHHTHPITWDTSESVSATIPPSRTFRIFRKLLGKMKDYNTGIENKYTSGSWTSPSQQIDAESLNKVYWNESITATATDNILIHTRTGATKTACEAASWSSALSDPNGSEIASTANVWIQYKIEFTADDTKNDNPKVYFTNAFVVRYTYEKGATNAETSVNHLYEFGFRNFDSPMQDKFFKKIGTVHEGTQGSFTFSWETNISDDSFEVSLASHPERWESFFHDTARGEEINFSIAKNDLFPFRLSELKGVYSEAPMIL